MIDYLNLSNTLRYVIHHQIQTSSTRVDTTYPGILVEYPNGYMIEDGVHRIGKLQREGIYESLFYVVTPLEYKKGLVCMTFRWSDKMDRSW